MQNRFCYIADIAAISAAAIAGRIIQVAGIQVAGIQVYDRGYAVGRMIARAGRNWPQHVKLHAPI